MSSISSIGTTSFAASAGMAAREGKRLEGLQALRGLAALLVVLLHTAQMAGLFEGSNLLHVAISRASTMGYFGVDIFFVLSGVVISILLRRNEKQPEAPGAFLLRRAAKLLPTFWVTVGLMVLLPTAPIADNSLGQFVAQPLTLILLVRQEALPVGWTLVYEAHFYIVAALALCFGARAEKAMLGWIVLQMLLVGLAAGGLLPKLTFFGPLSLELCAGLLIGRMAPRLPLRSPGFVALAVLGWMLAAALTLPIYGLVEEEWRRLLLCGMPAMLLVYAVLSLDAAGWQPPKVALWLGEISYSLYMWHIVVLMALGSVMMGWLSVTSTPLLYWGMGLALSILVARAAYQFIEAPPTRLANRLTRSQPVGAGGRTPH